ncbi:Env9p [Lipomyces kononenkoae]
MATVPQRDIQREAAQAESHWSPSEPTFTEQNYPDLTGKTFVVTGGYTGIGYEVSRLLANQNACAESAIARLQEGNKSAIFDFAELDLADLTTIKSGAQYITSRYAKIHGIVTNAGVMAPPVGSRSKQGYELQLATNVLGHQLLQHFLDPVIIDTAKNEPANTLRTIWSKCLNVYQSYLWGINHPDSQVVSVAVHPGYLQTELARYMSAQVIQQRVSNRSLFPPLYGAYTELYALLSPDVTTADLGDYYIPWGTKGYLRNDIYESRDGPIAEKIDKWIQEQIGPYK